MFSTTTSSYLSLRLPQLSNSRLQRVLSMIPTFLVIEGLQVFCTWMRLVDCDHLVTHFLHTPQLSKSCRFKMFRTNAEFLHPGSLLTVLVNEINRQLANSCMNCDSCYSFRVPRAIESKSCIKFPSTNRRRIWTAAITSIARICLCYTLQSVWVNNQVLRNSKAPYNIQFNGATLRCRTMRSLQSEILRAFLEFAVAGPLKPADVLFSSRFFTGVHKMECVWRTQICHSRNKHIYIGVMVIAV